MIQGCEVTFNYFIFLTASATNTDKFLKNEWL